MSIEIRYQHLINQRGSHNKYYDIYEISDGTSNGPFLLVTNWGRLGTSGTGQWKVDRHWTRNELRTAASDKFYEKYYDKDYERVKEETSDALPTNLYAVITEKITLSTAEQEWLDNSRGTTYPAGSLRPGKSRPAFSEPTPEPTDPFDQLSAALDTLLRDVGDDPSPEAIVQLGELSDTLDQLRSRVEIAEAQIDLVRDVITARMGADL